MNRIHSALATDLVTVPFDRLFSKSGLAWLAGAELRPGTRAAVDCELRLIETYDRELDLVEKTTAGLAWAEDRVKLLMTMPGVDLAVAVAIHSALGDVTRFPSPDRAASYLGLVPRTRQSGGRCVHGRITKAGNGHARWMLVQAAQHLGGDQGPLGAFFRKIARRKCRNVAVVATARKLVVIAWHMLRNNEPYRYSRPARASQKLARLRILATGRKRKGGTRKGEPRPAAYGTGEGTRRVPALGEVYRREGLPPAKTAGELTAGEVRALEATGSLELAVDVNIARRVPRAPSRS
jgi:hypothetical protein